MTDKASTFKLGKLVEIKHGFAFESTGFADNGEYALLTPGNFHETGGFRPMGELQKKYTGTVDPKWILSPGAVLIAMTEQAAGLLGSALRVPEQGRWLHNQRMGLVEIKHPDRLDLGFLFHWFNSPTTRKAVSVAASGTKVRHSSPSQLHALDICLPSLKRQEIIARALDAWDFAMTDAQDLVNCLERRRQGLMQQLLTGHQRLKGFRKTWPKYRLRDLFTEVTRQPSTPAPVLSISAGRGFLSQKERFNREVSAATLANYTLIERGEFAYNKGNSKTYTCGCIYALNEYEAAAIPSVYISFRPTTPINTRFFEFFFEADMLKAQLTRIINSGVRNDGLLNLATKDFFNMRIQVPDLNEQGAIAEVLNEAAETVRLQRRQLEAFQQQKRALLQRLLSGEPA